MLFALMVAALIYKPEEPPRYRWWEKENDDDPE